jgi:hypothetical protein
VVAETAELKPRAWHHSRSAHFVTKLTYIHPSPFLLSQALPPVPLPASVCPTHTHERERKRGHSWHSAAAFTFSHFQLSMCQTGSYWSSEGGESDQALGTHELIAIHEYRGPLHTQDWCPDHTKLSVRLQLWNCWGLCSEIDIGPPFFILLQPEMPTDGARSVQCDQPLRGWSHRPILTPSVGISGYNSVESGGLTSISQYKVERHLLMTTI